MAMVPSARFATCKNRVPIFLVRCSAVGITAPRRRLAAPCLSEAGGASLGAHQLQGERPQMQSVEFEPETREPAPATVVEATGLTRRYGEGSTAVDALDGVSVEVARGRLTAVMGPSGSGKSTLMHILAGLDTPSSGEVRIAGTALSKLSDTQLTRLRREHIGFVFQFFNLLPMLTAKENILLPLSIAGEKP